MEKRAQDGECTKLIFNPATPGDLAPNGNVNVTSRLETIAGESVQKVKWTATATKGSVSPANASTAQPSWTITGAADGPEVARIPVRAVSPAGISELPWVGGLTFPPSYSGSVSLRTDFNGLVEDWQGTFTWVRSSIQQNPGKTQLVRYVLSAGTVSAFTASLSTGSAVCTGGSTGQSGAVVFGDLEILVDPAGAWRSAFQVDVDAADFPLTFMPPPSPPLPHAAKAVLNSRQMPGSLLRPMTAAGPISATNVTDVGPVTVLLSTASWNLQPGK